MDIVAMLTDLLAKISALQSSLVDAQAAAESIAIEARALGFAEGVASVVVPPPSDKLYSEEELQVKIAEALLPVQDELAAVKLDLEQVKASIDQIKVDAVAAFKIELLAKYQEMQVVEQAAETGFETLLK